jgi:hypothetical protein
METLKDFQKPEQSSAETMRKLDFRTRLAFDYPRMTRNSGGGQSPGENESAEPHRLFVVDDRTPLAGTFQGERLSACT